MMGVEEKRKLIRVKELEINIEKLELNLMELEEKRVVLENNIDKQKQKLKELKRGA